MKASTFIRKTLKIIAWTVMSLILLAGAATLLVYSPWGQDGIRRFAVNEMNKNGMQLQVNSLRLRWPLNLDLEGVELDMPGQSIRAARLSASLRVLPLLSGRAAIKSADLENGFFSIGAPDSAMYMTIEGREVSLRGASVKLATMNIDLDDGFINGGRVRMTLNPDTTATDTATAEPAEMKIKVKRLALNDFEYSMKMLPTIDSLGARIPQATMTAGIIDLKEQTINIGSFTGGGLDATYLVPDSATIAATPVVPESTDTATVAPWTISIDTIGFSHSSALYTTRGVKPLPGLDFTYIQVDSLDLGIKNFYNRATVVNIPIRVSATERCGVRLSADGTLAVSESGTGLNDFTATTPNGTNLAFSALIGMGDMTTDPSTPLMLDLDGGIAAADARLMFPAFMPYLVTLPRSSLINAKANIHGTAGNLAIARLAVAVNGTVRLNAKGRVLNAFDPAKIGGNLTLSGALIDLNRFKPVLFDKATAAQFNFPETTFTGKVDMNAGHIVGDLEARTAEGRLSLDADWHSRLEDYDVHLTADRFPVNAFMPLLGVGEISATLDAKGHGYNPFVPTMQLDADLDVTRAVYEGYDYRGIQAKAVLAQGIADLNLNSSNPNAQATLDARGNLDGDTYDWTARLDGRHIDLKALGLSPTDATVTANLDATASITPKTSVIGAKVTLNSLTYSDQIGSTNLKNIVANLNANDSVTNLSLANGDLYTFISSESSLDSIMARFTDVSNVLAEEMAAMSIDVDRLQRALPPFTLDLTAGSNNMLTDMLAESRTTFDNLHVEAANDSSLSLSAQMLALRTPTMRLDTTDFNLSQYGSRLIFDGRVENRPGTFDEWAHVKLDGYMADNMLGLQLSQHNIQGKEGYNVGLKVELEDSTATLMFDPTDPTIAYMPWAVNDDNFISWSFAHKHLDANLHMHSATSSLTIYTDHIDGNDDQQEELVVDISDINIADWIKLNPFAPPMKGLLSADMRLRYEDQHFNGKGSVTLADFTYGKQRVGTIRSDLDIATDLNGMVRANADILVDGAKTMTLAGTLNDSISGSPLAMDLSLIHFPLATVNPFLPPGMATLSGTLNGQMDVTGTATAPTLNGWLNFDSTAVRVAMTATSYTFNDVRIPVEDNVVRFNDFSIKGVNDNPLRINGTVDIHNFASPRVDLSLNADNMQIVNSKKAVKGAEIYGKGFITLNTTVKGDMNFMAVNAALTILSGTNLTYVMPDAVNAITEQANGDLVKFVNFADSAAVQQADSITESQLAMLIEATLTVQTGSTINVDLSTNGRNRVSLQPDGTLDFSMQPFGEPRLTGRLNIPKGFVRYTPPVLSEKYFSFQPESYIAFNGNMMNPTLNVHAVDVLKANVTQTGQNSRLVNFNVLLAVTGTLENMKVAFDLTTQDDVTVANELQSMSAEQRANQAMNMLLYNVYTGPGTKGDSNLSGNAVYSFLSSQLNNWAANNIKGVDLTFGIDQYDRTVGGSTSQTTSYSYQVSKSLFNDRFKIVVGGNYSTDANADENFSQNLIKDISFEYFINKAQTMYVRLFRHTGYESILEGEITRTGVGFVYKRKLSSLKNLFRFHRKRKKTAPVPAEQTTTPQTVENKPDETK